MACRKAAVVHQAEHPAEVKDIPGSAVKQVTLTEQAALRLDVKTDLVREQDGRIVVPYSSVIYDPKGLTWVYTSPGPRTFVRHEVQIERIVGDLVVLKVGPPAGTVIASRAVAELYGTEFKVGH
jgi:hypothetical protein